MHREYKNKDRTIDAITSSYWQSLCHCYLQQTMYVAGVFAHLRAAALGKYSVVGLTPLWCVLTPLYTQSCCDSTVQYRAAVVGFHACVEITWGQRPTLRL